MSVVQEQPVQSLGAMHNNIQTIENTEQNTSMEEEQEAEQKEEQVTSTATEPASTVLSTLAAADNDVLFSPQLLKMYYSRLFPFSLLHSWLSYGGKDPAVFSRREFSFTLDRDGEEIYLRYKSFPSGTELQQAVLNHRPAKIDIGAVFSHDPNQKSSLPESRFKPVQREFVLDVDLTDYDDVRQCGCTGAKICGKCWTFMQMAVKVMDEGLRQDFGFQHIAWFYSGRRGVHAWVCDEEARFLTDEGRSAVASYFEVDLGSDRNKEMKLPYPLHPMLRRALDVLEPLFIEHVLPASGHGLLHSSDKWGKFLDLLPEDAAKVQERLKKEWKSSEGDESKTPAERWSELKTHLSVFAGHKAGNAKSAKRALSTKQQMRIESWPAEIVFRYTYPRLDINVSKKQNHLLKSPFCVHPKTGRVCVPIQARDIDSFDPFQVPTIPQLMRELDEYDRQNGQSQDENGKSKIFNWEKTSLKSYYDPFLKEFIEPMHREIRRKEKDASEEQAALAGDF